MQRVFAIDVFECPRCSEAMTLLGLDQVVSGGTADGVVDRVHGRRGGDGVSGAREQRVGDAAASDRDWPRQCPRIG